VKRIGRDRFVRNVCLALGNGGDAAAVPVLRDLAKDASVPVRAHAAWALKQLLPAAEFAAFAASRRAVETDAGVLAELTV
jgi:epoxyqueuosine reductase